MDGLGGVASHPIPDGWRMEAFFERLVTAGVCSYAYLRSPATTAKDVFRMLRLLDFKMYREAKARENARASSDPLL